MEPHFCTITLPVKDGSLSLVLREQDEALTNLFLPGSHPTITSQDDTPLLRAAQEQLREYFAGLRHIFTLPLAPTGTPFQLRCWAALQTIPYGQVRSYAWLAQAVDSPKGFRAVGMANHRNPLPILIPCHRVIGADGRLIGYGGGLPLKRALLLLEGAAVKEG